MNRIAHLLSGRLLVRNLRDRQCALVGVVELPADLVIRENASYLLLLMPGSAEVVDAPLDAGLPDELEGQGINAALHADVWRRTKVPGALCVRFFPALRDQNLWVVYGASDQPIPDALPDASCGDCWLSIREGRVSPMAAPASSRGASLAQMLTNHPVWPDPSGELYSFPQHPPRWCEHYHRMSKLLAQAGAGAISEADAQAQLRADPFLDRIRPWNPDRDYLRFLAAMDAGGALHLEGPRRAPEHAARDAASIKLIRELRPA